MTPEPVTRTVPPFSRQFFGAPERFTRIGDGSVGGKAAGLLSMRSVLEALPPPRRVDISVPRLTVISTDFFKRFLDQNALERTALSGAPDDRIALAFQRAELPADLVGDLRALIEHVHTPLAVRSSSLLEDALGRPFAGVYATKMLPNNQLDADSRFRRLVEAVKFVYASTYFADAVAYRRAAGCGPAEDRMAVIVQEVVGRRHGPRFYPDVSGVARSYSFYRDARSRPEDGSISLALGLGRTIVDEGVAWNYSPRYPAAPPPVSSIRERAGVTQNSLWAVNMGTPPEHDPIRETEYLVRAGLAEAEEDGTLHLVGSTYDVTRDRLVPGVAVRGPRIVDFAPLLVLRRWNLHEAVVALLGACERAWNGAVEIEFAATLHEDDSAYLGFLQVRPLVVAADRIDVPPEALDLSDAFVASDLVLGNGGSEDIRDVVYVRPDRFDPRLSREVAREVSACNQAAADAGYHYVLIGFGRWGTSDPWLGIPCTWPQVSSARVIVEATLPAFRVELTQGSHFFHNISSAGVLYFSVREGHGRIDWPWLTAQPAVHEGTMVRHVRLERPLRVRVDGRSGRGVIIR